MLRGDRGRHLGPHGPPTDPSPGGSVNSDQFTQPLQFIHATSRGLLLSPPRGVWGDICGGWGEKHIIKIRKDNGFFPRRPHGSGLGRKILHFRDISGCQFRAVSHNVILSLFTAGKRDNVEDNDSLKPARNSINPASLAGGDDARPDPPQFLPYPMTGGGRGRKSIGHDKSAQ